MRPAPCRNLQQNNRAHHHEGLIQLGYTPPNLRRLNKNAYRSDALNVVTVKAECDFETHERYSVSAPTLLGPKGGAWTYGY